MTPYIFLPGTCAEAFEFYAEVFGGEVTEMRRWADMPDAAGKTAAEQALVMHAELRIGDALLMGADDPAPDYAAPCGVSLYHAFDDPDRARRVFLRLAKHGEVRMDFAATFWSAGFGTCTDRFGVRWMISVAG